MANPTSSTCTGTISSVSTPSTPALNAGLLGVLTLLIVPVQILLVAFAMRGFSQGWNVELERREPTAGTDLGQLAPPQPA